MHRVWTDFNSREEDSWIRFWFDRSHEDLKNIPDLREGQRAVAHDDEMEIEVILQLRQGYSEAYWVGEPVSDYREVT